MLRIEKRIIQFGIFDDDNENDWIEEVVEESPTNQQAEKDVWNDTDSPFEVENNQQNNAQQQQQFQQQQTAQQNYMQQQAYIMQQQQMQAQQIARQQAYQEAVKRATTINPATATKKEPMSKKNKIILGSSVGGGLALVAILAGVTIIGVSKSKQRAIINDAKNNFEKASAEIQDYIDSHKKSEEKKYALNVIENLEKTLVEIKGKYTQIAKSIKDPNAFKKDVEIFIANLKNNHSSAKSSVVDLETQYVRYKLIKDKYEEIIRQMKSADSSTGLYGSNDLYKFYSETNKEDSLYFRITNPNSEFSIANKVFSAGTTKKEAEEAVDKLNARWPKWKTELENFKDLYVSMLQTKKSLEVKESNTTDQAVKELVKKQIQEISSLLDFNNRDRDYVSWDTWINQPQVLSAHNLKYYEDLLKGDENKIREFSEFLLKYVSPTLEAIKNLIRTANSYNRYKDFCTSMNNDYTNFTRKAQPYAFNSLEDVKKFDDEVKAYYASKKDELDNMVALFNRLEKLNSLVNDYVVKTTSQTNFKEIFEKAKLHNVSEIIDNSISLDNFKPVEHYKWYLSIKDNVAQYPNTEVYAVLAKTLNKQDQYLKKIYRSNNNNLTQMQTIYNDFCNVFKKTIVDICRFEQKRDSVLAVLNNVQQWINSLTNFNSYNYDEFKKELRQKLEDDRTNVKNFMNYSEIETFATFEKYLDFYTKAIENVTPSNQDVEKNYKYREQIFKKNIDELKQLENTLLNSNFLSQPNSFSKYTIEKNNLSIKVQDLLKNKENSLTFTNLNTSLSSFKTKWSDIQNRHNELKIAYDALKKAIDDSSLILNQLQSEFEFLFNKLTLAKTEAQNDYGNGSAALDKEFYDNSKNTLNSIITTINAEKIEYQKLVDEIDNAIGKTDTEGYKKTFNDYKDKTYLKVETKKLFDLYTTNSLAVKRDLKKVSLDQAKQNKIEFLNQLSSSSNEITTRFGIHEQLEQKIKEITNELEKSQFKPEPKTVYSYLGEDIKNYLELTKISLAKDDETNTKWTEHINELNSKWANAVQTYQNHKKAIEDLQALIEEYKNVINSTSQASSEYKDELFNIIRTEENAYAQSIRSLSENVDTTLEKIQEKTTELANKKAKILTTTGEFALHKVAFNNFESEINKFDNIFSQTNDIHNKLVANFGNLVHNSFEDLKNKNSNIKTNNDNFKFVKSTTKTSEYQQKLQGIKSLIFTSQSEINTRTNIYSILNTNFEETNTYLTSLGETSPVKFVKANRKTKFDKYKQEFVALFNSVSNNYDENNQISEKINNYFIKTQWEEKVNKLVGYGNLIIKNFNDVNNVYNEIVQQQNNTGENLILTLDAITKHNVDKTYKLFKEKKIENTISIDPLNSDKLIEALLSHDNNESFILFNQYAKYFEKSGHFSAKRDVDFELKKLWVTKFVKEISKETIQTEISNHNNFYQIVYDYFGINQQRNTNAFIKEKLDKFLSIREFEKIKDNSFEEIKAFSQEYTINLFNKIKKTREEIEALNANTKWTNIKNYLLKYYTYFRYSGNYPDENNTDINKINEVIADNKYLDKSFQIKNIESATAWFNKSNELTTYLQTIVSSEKNISSTTQKTFEAYLEYYKTETIKKFSDFFNMQKTTLQNVHTFILKNSNSDAFNLSRDFNGIISSFKSFKKIHDIDNSHLYNSEFLTEAQTKIDNWQNEYINKIDEWISKNLDRLDSTSELWNKFYSSVDAVSTFKKTLKEYVNKYVDFKTEREKFKVSLDKLNGYLENLKKLKDFVNNSSYDNLFGDIKQQIDEHYKDLETKYIQHSEGYTNNYKNKSKIATENSNILSYISNIKKKNEELATKIVQQINTCIWQASSSTYNNFDKTLGDLNKYFKPQLTQWFDKINNLFSSIEEANNFKTMVLNYAINKFNLIDKFNENGPFADILSIDKNNNNNSFTWLSKVINELNTLKVFSSNSIIEQQDKKFIVTENNNDNIMNAMGRSIIAIKFLNSKGNNLLEALKPVHDLFEAIFTEFESVDVLGDSNDIDLKSKIYASAIRDNHIYNKDCNLGSIGVNSSSIININEKLNSITKRNDIDGELTIKSTLKITINNSNHFILSKEQTKTGFFKLGQKNGVPISVDEILKNDILTFYAKNYNSGSTNSKGIFTQKVKKQDKWTLQDGTNNLDKMIVSEYKYLWNKNAQHIQNRNIVINQDQNTLQINNSNHFYPAISYYDKSGNIQTKEFTNSSEKYNSIFIDTNSSSSNYETNVNKVKRYHREFLKYYSMLSALFQKNNTQNLIDFKNDYEVRKVYILLKLFFDSIDSNTLEILDNHTLDYVLNNIFGLSNTLYTSFSNKLKKFESQISTLLTNNSNYMIFDISTASFTSQENIDLTTFINEKNKYIFSINNGKTAEELLQQYINSSPSNDQILKAISTFINTEQGFSNHIVFENNQRKFISNCLFNNNHNLSFVSQAYSGNNEVFIINSDISALTIEQNVDKLIIRNSKIDTVKFEGSLKEIEVINSNILNIEKTNESYYQKIQKIHIDNTNFNENNFIKLINEVSRIQYKQNGFDLELNNIYEEIDLSKFIKKYIQNKWNDNLFEITSENNQHTGNDPKLQVNNNNIFNSSNGSRNDINNQNSSYSKIKSFVVNNSYLKRTDLLKYTNPHISKININDYRYQNDTFFVKKIKDSTFDNLFEIQNQNENTMAFENEISSKQYLFAELKENYNKFEVKKHIPHDQKYNFDFVVSRLEKLLLNDSFIEGNNIIDELPTEIKINVNERIKFYNQTISFGINPSTNIEFDHLYDNNSDSQIKDEIKRWLATKFFDKKAQNQSTINTYYNCWMGLNDQIGINTLQFTNNFVSQDIKNLTYKTISNSNDWNDISTYQNNSEYIKGNVKY